MTQRNHSQIAALADETRGSVTASLVLVSPASIVEALVRNSIRACLSSSQIESSETAAGTVVVLVDFERWSISVKDDGIGFPQRLDMSSSLGSAKKGSLELISHIALVQIRSLSRRERRRSSASDASADVSRLIRDGRMLLEQDTSTSADHASSLPDSLGRLPLLDPKGGSSVVVHDVFGKLPVRRKALRTMVAQKKQIDQVKTRIQQLSLLYPGIAFRLSVKHAPEEAPRLKTTGDAAPSSSNWRADEKMVLSIPKTSSGIARFGDIYDPNLVRSRRVHEFQANHVLSEEASGSAIRPDTASPEVMSRRSAQRLGKTSARTSVAIRVEGFFSTYAYDGKGGPAQAIFINGERLPSSGASLLFEPEEVLSSAHRNIRLVLDRLGLVAVRSAESRRRWPEARPATSSGVGTSDCAESWDSVYDSFADAVVKRLASQGKLYERQQVAFLARISAEPLPADSYNVGKTEERGADVPFSFDMIVTVFDKVLNGERPELASKKRLLSSRQPDDGRRKRSKASEPARQSATSLESSLVVPAAPEGMELWQDPVTRRCHFVDTRTGSSFHADDPRFRPPLDQDSGPASRQLLARPATAPGSTVYRAQLAKTASGASSAGSRPEWLRQALEGWKNPAFDSMLQEPAEARVPALHDRPRTAAAAAISYASGQRRMESYEGGVEATPSPSSSPRKSGRPRTESRFFQRLSKGGSGQPVRTSERIRHDVRSHCSGVSAGEALRQTNGSATAMFGAVESSIPASSLRDAEVVGQVDEKFVACLLRLPAGITAATSTESSAEGIAEGHDGSLAPTHQALVCIDQHAADERVRSERFLSDYLVSCASEAGALSIQIREGEEVQVPIDAEVLETLAYRSPHLDEEGLLQSMERELRRWGFRASVTASTQPLDPTSTRGEENGRVTVEVSAVPEVWSDRVLRPPGLLASEASVAEREEVRRAVRDHLAAFARRRKKEDWPTDDDAGAKTAGEEKRQEVEWFNVALGELPQRVRAWIATKACRCAIMFNDPLDRSQCERLVQRLAECQFPFICAHGRPSVVPVCLI